MSDDDHAEEVVESDADTEIEGGLSAIINACNPKTSPLNWLLLAVPFAAYTSIAHLDPGIQFLAHTSKVLCFVF